MAKTTNREQAMGDQAGAVDSSASTNDSGVDAVDRQDQSVTRETESGQVEVHFNPATGLAELVMEDGTRVKDGDLVDKAVADKLNDRKIDGYDLLVKEAS